MNLGVLATRPGLILNSYSLHGPVMSFADEIINSSLSSDTTPNAPYELANLNGSKEEEVKNKVALSIEDETGRPSPTYQTTRS